MLEGRALRQQCCVSGAASTKSVCASFLIQGLHAINLRRTAFGLQIVYAES